MDTEEKIVVAALAIGGAAVALFVLLKPKVYGMLKPVGTGTGWSNEETVQVVRNQEGMIDHIIIHRDVHGE